MTNKRRRQSSAEAKALPAVIPNAGIEADYRRRLKKLIAAMQASVTYWLTASYRANMAQDSATSELRAALRGLSKQWQRNFDDGAQDLAKWFAKKTKSYADGRLQAILKDAGFAVEFRMSEPMRDAYQAVIGENVGLIKSIASEYLTQVEGLVMRSVQEGRDLSHISTELAKRYGITKRRAQLISRDQNNKASSVMARVRQKELGITQAVWRHSHAGEVPRPEHEKWDGEVYDIDKGMWSEVDKQYVWPGTPVNCRCTARPIIPGL